MVDIPEPVAKMIKSPDTNKVLTTVSPDGKPHAIICASLTIDDKDRIVVGEVYMHRSAENISKNPNVEILVWQGKTGYSLQAVAVGRYTEGEMFDKMNLLLDKYNLTAVAVWEFEATSIWDESATRTAGDQVI